MLRRTFTREFKLELCRLAESGELSKSRICREHALCPTVLDRWIDQFRAKGDEAFDGGSWRPRSAAPESRIRELEAALGRAHLEIEFLQEALGKFGSRRGRKDT